MWWNLIFSAQTIYSLQVLKKGQRKSRYRRTKAAWARVLKIKVDINKHITDNVALDCRLSKF